MILKLEMPPVNRIVSGGQIIKWHKKEGDWVNYGDLLVDVHGELTEEFKQESRRPGPYPFGIVSSDRGTLKAIRAVEGSRHAEGALLAVLESSGTPSDPVDDASLESASRFRVTVNLSNH